MSENIPFKLRIQDPVSALTHMIAFVACIPILCVLVTISAIKFSWVHVVSFAIFGASLLFLYGASTVYHIIPLAYEKARRICRKIDHMMIFVLIAGTYTPVCLVTLRGVWGYSLLAVIWGAAIIGIVLKSCVKDLNRWVSTVLYITMGWAAVFVLYPLYIATSIGAIILLVAGGLMYTIGGVIYALKWPKLNLRFFGFHEIFHLFVIAGTVFHIVFMFIYVR